MLIRVMLFVGSVSLMTQTALAETPQTTEEAGPTAVSAEDDGRARAFFETHLWRIAEQPPRLVDIGGAVLAEEHAAARIQRRLDTQWTAHRLAHMRRRHDRPQQLPQKAMLPRQCA